MLKHLPPTPLLILSFLAGTLGCTKKDDATPSKPVIDGSYQLDSKTIPCGVAASGGYANGSGRSGLDYDYVDLTIRTEPEPATGVELLQLNYSRPNPGEPYKFSSAVYFYTNGSSKPTEFGGTTGTLTVNRDGTVSGTFAAQVRNYGGTPSPYSAITAGTFTNVSIK